MVCWFLWLQKSNISCTDDSCRLDLTAVHTFDGVRLVFAPPLIRYGAFVISQVFVRYTLSVPFVQRTKEMLISSEFHFFSMCLKLL